MRLLRSRLVLASLTVLGLLSGLALAAFQPWRLITDTTVSEALPAPISSGPASSGRAGSGTPSEAGLTVLATGRFVSHAHRTTGRVRLLQLPDGGRILRLEDLDTSDGPALHVWLSDQPVRAGRSGWSAFDDGTHLDLGELKGNRGNQNYAVPATADLSRLSSVSVWCARFHVSFGATPLTPATGSGRGDDDVQRVLQADLVLQPPRQHTHQRILTGSRAESRLAHVVGVQ